MRRLPFCFLLRFLRVANLRIAHTHRYGVQGQKAGHDAGSVPATNLIRTPIILYGLFLRNPGRAPGSIRVYRYHRHMRNNIGLLERLKSWCWRYSRYVAHRIRRRRAARIIQQSFQNGRVLFSLRLDFALLVSVVLPCHNYHNRNNGHAKFPPCYFLRSPVRELEAAGGATERECGLAIRATESLTASGT